MAKKATYWSERKAEAVRCSVTPESLTAAFDYMEEQTIPDLDCTLGELFEQFPEEDSVPSTSEAAGTIKHARKMVDGGWACASNAERSAPSPITQNHKLQLSISSATEDLLKHWASSENRAVSDVAMLALETGLKALKAQGAIPEVALEATELRSRRRLAQAEAKAAAMRCLNGTVDFNF